MHRNAWIGALLAGLLSPALAGTTPPPNAMEDVLTMRVDGEIVVDSTGRLVSHTVKTKLPTELRGALDKGMAAWEFDPPGQDAALAATPVRITLSAKPLPDKAYEVRVESITFASVKKDAPRIVLERSRPRPKFPPYPITGVVTVEVSIGADGVVMEADATHCSLHDVKGPRQRMQQACNQLEANGVKAMRKWKFAVDGRGDPISYPVMAAIQFYYLRGEAKLTEAGQWLKETRTAYRRPSWRPIESVALRVGSSDFWGRSTAQGDSALQLRDGFTGKKL